MSDKQEQAVFEAAFAGDDTPADTQEVAAEVEQQSEVDQAGEQDLDTTTASDAAPQGDVDGEAEDPVLLDGLTRSELRRLLGNAADALDLFVLAAVADRHGAFARQDAAVLELARDLQASTVAFRAARRGWGRVLGPEWAPRGTDEFVRIVHGRRKRQGNPGAESTG